MEYIVVLRRENVYSTARLDSEEAAFRLIEALHLRGYNARMLARPA